MNKSFKKLIISILSSVVILGCSFLGFSEVLKHTNNDLTYVNWMKNLDDETSLRDVNMPGSHDTMALYSIGDFAGQCQSLSLEDQLNLGVRFLDIRLQEVENKLKAVHGFVDQKIGFDKICSTIENFINNNKSEFIIMSVKEESDASKSTISFEDSLKSYLKSDIYILNNEIPSKVKDVRGKVILLSRYSNSTIGIPAYDEWLDSCSFTMNKNDIYVQDTYKIDSAKMKQDEIISCLNEKGHALKINFLSAYRTNYFPISYAPSAALDINPWIYNEINKYSDRGIVAYDFITLDMMKGFFKNIL